MDGNDGILVDAGWNDDNAFRQLREALESINFEFANLRTILISHLHPDHYGLASKLKQVAPDSKLLLHQRDAQDAVYTLRAYEALMQTMRSFLKSNGVGESEIGQIERSGGFERQFSGLTRPDTLLNGGEKLVAGKWKLEVISTPGHTKGNVCLFDSASNLLFSGDHILPKITPNVSLSPLYLGDPLGDYLRSLRGLKKLNPDRILPSHEYVFNHLGERIKEIEEHHDRRLAEVMAILSKRTEASTGYEVAKELRWSVGNFSDLTAWQKGAAITETLAHLEYLRRNGNILEVREGTPEEEIITYSKIIPQSQ
jgi:glyoxylase-like metal-dependent hydrolase (beta-lactamase superfamily II)